MEEVDGHTPVVSNGTIVKELLVVSNSWYPVYLLDVLEDSVLFRVSSALERMEQAEENPEGWERGDIVANLKLDHDENNDYEDSINWCNDQGMWDIKDRIAALIKKVKLEARKVTLETEKAKVEAKKEQEREAVGKQKNALNEHYLEYMDILAAYHQHIDTTEDKCLECWRDIKDTLTTLQHKVVAHWPSSKDDTDSLFDYLLGEADAYMKPYTEKQAKPATQCQYASSLSSGDFSSSEEEDEDSDY